MNEYKGKVQNVVLGCTHYPLAIKEIQKVLGNVNFFNGAKGVSRQLKRVLEEKELLNNEQPRGNILFLDSSPSEEMRNEKLARFYKFLSEENI